MDGVWNYMLFNSTDYELIPITQMDRLGMELINLYSWGVNEFFICSLKGNLEIKKF